MDGFEVNNDSDLKELIERVWNTPLGLEATQDLHDGVLLEQYHENIYVVHTVKTTAGWEVIEGKATKIPPMRLFFFGDALETLANAENIEDFSTKVQDLVGDRNIVFISLTTPEKLIEVGFAEFAERLGLPGK